MIPEWFAGILVLIIILCVFFFIMSIYTAYHAGYDRAVKDLKAALTEHKTIRKEE